MGNKGLIGGLTENIDEPIPTGIFDFIKKGKLQCRIYYEDGSYKDFYKKFTGTYVLDIKGRTYFVIPKCIIKGKHASISWFFNNPTPINYAYQQSVITAKDLIEKTKLNKLPEVEQEVLANIKLDSDGLHSLFNTKLMQGLYANGGISAKNIIIILIILLIVILVILQVTGTIDMQGIISG